MSARAIVAALALTVLLPASRAAAQDLADFDYENLSFRGVGLEWGYLFPSRVETDPSFGMRFDLGYLGPGLRVVPSVTYWSSKMTFDEVRELEGRIYQLTRRNQDPQTPPVQIDLGEIFWSDLVLGLDTHVMWAMPFGLLGYTGVGAAAHIQNGSGDAIDGTFVEDLLDSLAAGFNLHTGIEVPVGDRLRLYGTARYEMTGDLRYLEFRVGSQVMFGPSAPGELRR